MRYDMLETILKYKIIDAHGHIGYNKETHTPGNDARAMVESMNKVGIEKVCVSSIAGLELDPVYGNNMVADAISNFGERFLGYACINPFEQDEIIPELERCFDKLGMAAIKLHAEMCGCPSDSELYIPVYEFAHERKLVILNHSWDSADNLAAIASKYYNAKFIQAHDGSAWDGNTVEEIMDVVKHLDNAWLDTAGSDAYLGAFEKTVEFMGEDKLLFGTDFPFIDPCRQVGNIVFSDISEEAKKKILRTNFLQLIAKVE